MLHKIGSYGLNNLIILTKRRPLYLGFDVVTETLSLNLALKRGIVVVYFYNHVALVQPRTAFENKISQFQLFLMVCTVQW